MGLQRDLAAFWEGGVQGRCGLRAALAALFRGGTPGADPDGNVERVTVNHSLNGSGNQSFGSRTSSDTPESWSPPAMLETSIRQAMIEGIQNVGAPAAAVTLPAPSFK